MEFIIQKVSDDEKPCKNAKASVGHSNRLVWKVEIKTLEELIKLAKEVKNSVIVSCQNEVFEIIIYDDHIE